MSRMYALLLILISPVALSESVLTQQSDNSIIVDANFGKRVCYYRNQAYSDGAVIQVGEIYLICEAANNFETNGQLKWIQLDLEQKSLSE